MNAELLRRVLVRYESALIFGVIGVINTVLHTGTVVLMVESGLSGPVPANIAGFAVANTASFFANCRFTFRKQPAWALYRVFVGVSLFSLALTIALSALAETMHWHYLFGLALVVMVGPVLSYFLHKMVTFKPRA